MRENGAKEDSTRATIDAMREVTLVPKDEMQRIADEVRRKAQQQGGILAGEMEHENRIVKMFISGMALFCALLLIICM